MQLRISPWVLGAATLVAACQAGGARTNATPSATPSASPSASDDALVANGPAAPPHGKPQAPVELSLASRPVGGGTYEVTLTAVPTTAVKGLVLDLDGRSLAVGPTAAGAPRTLTTRVTLGQLRGRELAGSALVDVGSHRRRAAATLQLGVADAKAAPPITIVRMPDGSDVAEVRP